MSQTQNSSPAVLMQRDGKVVTLTLNRPEARNAVNGDVSSAKVALADRFGKPSSSCCLAWSESWTRPRD